MNLQELFRLRREGQLPSTPWVLPELVTSGRGIIYGRPKAGKSYAAAQIADALHHQKPLWWCPAPWKRYRVLYVMLDVPLDTMLGQLEHFLPGSEFEIVHFQLTDPEESIPRFPLNSPGGQARALRVVQAKQPDYVVWDGLTFLDSATNLNARESVMQMYEKLEKIWKGPQLLVVHANQTRELEDRHAVERVMGSKTLSADADWGVLIESKDDKGTRAKWTVWNRVQEDRVEHLRRIPHDQPGSGAWIVDTTESLKKTDLRLSCPAPASPGPARPPSSPRGGP